MNRHLLSIDDLTASDIERLFHLAQRFEGGWLPKIETNRTVGLLFYETSLRTRVGFTVASHRLGLNTVEVYEPRHSEISLPESWTDTLRTTSGYCSAIVTRPGIPLDRMVIQDYCMCPYVNGGDTGENAEHPTQALLDLYAIRVLSPDRPLRIVIWGDPTMRAARSLLKLLHHTDDHEVHIVSDRHFRDTHAEGSLTVHEPKDLAQIGADVLYATGMRHQSIPLRRREALIVGPTTMSALPDSAIVLSPMPVIDEISPEVRGDSRLKMQQQSDLGLFPRMAVLHEMLEPA